VWEPSRKTERQLEPKHGVEVRIGDQVSGVAVAKESAWIGIQGDAKARKYILKDSRCVGTWELRQGLDEPRWVLVSIGKIYPPLPWRKRVLEWLGLRDYTKMIPRAVVVNQKKKDAC